MPFNRYERQTVMGVLDRMNVATEASKSEPGPPAKPTLPLPMVLQGEVRLSVEDALRLALANNQDIQIAGLEPMSAEADIVHATAVYDPSVFLSNTVARQDRPIASQLDTGSIVPGEYIEKTWAAKGGVKELTPSGGGWLVYQEMSYLNTNSKLIFPNPQFTSRTTVELDQPLLQGLGDPVNQASIRIANLNAAMSIQDFRQKVSETCIKVIQAYWTVAYDMGVVRASQESHEMALEVLRRERARAGQGVSNDLNISRAASASASREAELIRLKNRIKTDADQLKHLMNAAQIPTDSEITVIPIDAPRSFIVDVDRTWSVTKALSRRPEIAKARAALAVNRERISAADSQLLPKLDSILKYTMNGLGTTGRGTLDSEKLDDLVSWSAEFDFTMPFGNRSAESDLRKRRIEYLQTVYQASLLTSTIVQEVNAAVRAVLQGREELEYTLKAVTAAKTVVRGELVRFELGELSNEELLRSQDIYAAAQRDHLQTILNFNLSLSELSRAQGTLIEDRNIAIIWPQDTPNALQPVAATIPPASPPPEKKPDAEKPADDKSADDKPADNEKPADDDKPTAKPDTAALPAEQAAAKPDTSDL